MVASGADIGLALDGDADRLIVVDEKGRLIDGDQLMALIAIEHARRGAAEGRRGGRDGDVQPRARAAAWRRTGIGLDPHRRSATAMCSRRCATRGCNVGGEQSGHIILTDHATTGDGLVAGLQVLAALVEAGRPASELLHQFEPVPQLLKNVRFNGGAPLETKAVKERDRRGRGRA